MPLLLSYFVSHKAVIGKKCGFSKAKSVPCVEPICLSFCAGEGRLGSEFGGWGSRLRRRRCLEMARGNTEHARDGVRACGADDVCKGQHVVLTRGRYLLFRRATRRYEKPCYASFFPSMPTERSRFLTTAAQIFQCIFSPACAYDFLLLAARARGDRICARARSAEKL